MSGWKFPPKGRLTDHFTWGELACRCCGRIPDEGEVRTTAAWLEVIRGLLGEPVHVNSGCRCPERNAAVGGVADSQHLLGKAADISVKGMTPREVCLRLLDYQGQGKLIGGMGGYPGFTHVDRGPARRWSG